MVRRHLLAPSRCPFSTDIASHNNNNSMNYERVNVVYREQEVELPPVSRNSAVDDSRFKMPPPPPPPPLTFSGAVNIEQHPFFRRPPEQSHHQDLRGSREEEEEEGLGQGGSSSRGNHGHLHRSQQLQETPALGRMNFWVTYYALTFVIR